MHYFFFEHLIKSFPQPPTALCNASHINDKYMVKEDNLMWGDGHTMQHIDAVS